jgi:serine/threonine protein kinase
MGNLIGKSLGRYHILEQLGEGGMATVYKAYDTRLERDVAIKVIRRGVFPPDQLDHILKRFEREAKALAKLSHPNIVRVLDYGDYDGAPYFVMEYLPGGTLKYQLGKPISWRESVRILLPIAEALEYAHEHKVIHRDIKPANILLTERGQPMLTDFGIAKILEVQETAALTGSGMMVGTPEYMAPEQWTGQTSAQSDIYSLAVVLYEMVTGRKPYIADTPAAILLKQATDPLPRPKVYVPGLPDAIEKVLLKALAKQPSDRYQDVTAFIRALKRLLSGEDVSQQVVAPARRRQAAETVDEWETETKTDSLERTPTGASVLPARSNTLIPGGIWVVIALCIVLTIVSVGGYALIMANKQTPTSRPSVGPNTIPPPTTHPPTDTSEPPDTPLSPTNTVIVTIPPPTNTVRPQTASFTANAKVYCRDTPSGLADTHYDFNPGDIAPVLGKWVQDFGWLLVDIDAPERTSEDCCWVYGEYGTLSVDPSQIEVIQEVPERHNCSAYK